MNPVPDIADLAVLEAQVERALDGEGSAALRVLGYGEISCVLSWTAGDREVACKRLPLFADAAELAGYRAALETYLARLDAAGIRVLPTRLQSIERADGRLAAYCLQPALPKGSLAPEVLERLPEADALRVLERIAGQIDTAVSSSLGLDAQLCNWALVGDELWYIDITTPMARDERGNELLDPKVFLASLPWALRGAVHRFVLQSILDKYYDRRGVLLDLAGNLHKERLQRLLPAFVKLIENRAKPTITIDEVHRYYRNDARTWRVLQSLRRADRFWQRRVRRRTYPFLLPAQTQR